ncbi:MAG: J domain-containing protein, partial [Deltaproteobacteria bacterium]
MDPYEVLGVSPQADDDTIRKAYLELVRRFSP